MTDDAPSPLTDDAPSPLTDDAPSPLTDRTAEVLSGMPEQIRATVEAQLALSLAGEIDMGRQLSIAPVAKELRNLMELLRGWSEARTAEADPVDDLEARRRERRSAGA